MMHKDVRPMFKCFVCVGMAIVLFTVTSCKKSPENPGAPTKTQTPVTTTTTQTPATAKTQTPATATTQVKDANSTAKVVEQPKTAANSSGLVPIDIKLPKALFIGTPQEIVVDNLEKPLGKPRPPFLAPAGVTNVALNKPVTGSDKFPIIGELSCITDGNKDSSDGNYVELNLGVQYIVIDLKAMYNIYAVVVWHLHKQPVVFFDVVVQTADDGNFIENVQTLFNNDMDNSAGQGIGKDMHYTETNEGKLIDAKGVKGRYVRLFSNGYNLEDFNYYTEVEVYGIPVK